jgi:hypothetical protein
MTIVSNDLVSQMVTGLVHIKGLHILPIPNKATIRQHPILKLRKPDILHKSIHLKLIRHFISSNNSNNNSNSSNSNRMTLMPTPRCRRSRDTTRMHTTRKHSKPLDNQGMIRMHTTPKHNKLLGRLGMGNNNNNNNSSSNNNNNRCNSREGLILACMLNSHNNSNSHHHHSSSNQGSLNPATIQMCINRSTQVNLLLVSSPRVNSLWVKLYPLRGNRSQM